MRINTSSIEFGSIGVVIILVDLRLDNQSIG
jgi:hypothetical protein